jgi:hypothetical protein
MNIDALLRIKADVQGENNIRRLGDSMQGVTGKVNNLKTAVGGLSASFKALGAALALGAFTAFIKSGIDAADAIGKASTRTGVAAEALIGYQRAAALSDVSNEQLIKGLTKLNVNMVAAAEGNEELIKRFQQLGISIKKEDGTLKTTEETLEEIADRFADMPDGAQKAAAAVSLFGKSGVELITILNGGKKILNEFKEQLSKDFQKRAELFNDTITKMGFKVQGFQMQLMDALLPALQSIIEVFSELFDSKQDWTALFDVIKAGLRTVATFIYANVALFGAMARGVVGAFQVVSQAVRGDFQGAWNTFSSTVSTQIQQAKKDFSALQKIWTDADVPGGATGRSGYQMRDLGQERERDAAATRAATAEQRAAEKAADNYNNSLLRSAELAEDLKRRIRDVNSATQGLGETARQAIDREYQEALNNIADEGERLKKQILELRELSGGSLMFEGLVNAQGTGLAQQYLNALGQQADVDRILKLGQLQSEEAQAAAAEAMERSQFGVGDGFLSGLADSITEARESLQELTAPLNIVRNAASSMGQAFGDAFRGLVSGSMTAKEALASFFQATADAFMDMAAQIITQLITITILESLSSIFSSASGLSGAGALGSGGPAVTSVSGTNISGAGLGLGSIGTPGSAAAFSGFLPSFAAGGIVTRPTLAMVGEGGEPEAIIPFSKMGAAMANWAGGQRGPGMVGSTVSSTTNSYSSSFGGQIPFTKSTERLVAEHSERETIAAINNPKPIDVRYESQVINGVEYVTAEQHQKGMAQAAERGRSLALSALQNSVKTRKRVGMA